MATQDNPATGAGVTTHEATAEVTAEADAEVFSSAAGTDVSTVPTTNSSCPIAGSSPPGAAVTTHEATAEVTAEADAEVFSSAAGTDVSTVHTTNSSCPIAGSSPPGRGVVVVERWIRSGSFVCDYHGTLVSKAEGERRMYEFQVEEAKVKELEKPSPAFLTQAQSYPTDAKLGIYQKEVIFNKRKLDTCRQLPAPAWSDIDDDNDMATANRGPGPSHQSPFVSLHRLTDEDISRLSSPSPRKTTRKRVKRIINSASSELGTPNKRPRHQLSRKAQAPAIEVSDKEDDTDADEDFHTSYPSQRHGTKTSWNSSQSSQGSIVHPSRAKYNQKACRVLKKDAIMERYQQKRVPFAAHQVFYYQRKETVTKRAIANYVRQVTMVLWQLEKHNPTVSFDCTNLTNVAIHRVFDDMLKTGYKAATLVGYCKNMKKFCDFLTTWVDELTTDDMTHIKRLTDAINQLQRGYDVMKRTVNRHTRCSDIAARNLPSINEVTKVVLLAEQPALTILQRAEDNDYRITSSDFLLQCEALSGKCPEVQHAHQHAAL
ncbi:unnamed protein product [Mytilus coruscus]|uniref:Uncharacterized protein n=1 Tax=Mytilus coruscus TaxID=42192 RepID=A0A6J8AII6_MYTCO|nr:unnamed protein product [Mytilus coruscus]